MVFRGTRSEASPTRNYIRENKRTSYREWVVLESEGAQPRRECKTPVETGTPRTIPERNPRTVVPNHLNTAFTVLQTG